jgi:putative hydrolase of HD superfamily
MSAEAVVQRQLEAYNAKDVEALMGTYAVDAQQFEHPATLLASGAAQIRERFLARFKEPNLHAQLVKRIVAGNIVIDHELVSRTFPEGTSKIELVAIYDVQNGKIAKAWFIPGAKTLDK